MFNSANLDSALHNQLQISSSLPTQMQMPIFAFNGNNNLLTGSSSHEEINSQNLLVTSDYKRSGDDNKGRTYYD